VTPDDGGRPGKHDSDDPIAELADFPLNGIDLIAHPIHPERNIAEIGLMLYALFIAVHTVILQPNPISVEKLLGTTWTIFWAVSLFGGALIALLGVFWRNRGLASTSIMQVGYVMFIPAALARGVALLGDSRETTAGVMFGLAIMCLARYLQLEYRISRFYSTGIRSRVRRSFWRVFR
jgi:hypothetical protein